jgi:hypothetical protein
VPWSSAAITKHLTAGEHPIQRVGTSPAAARECPGRKGVFAMMRLPKTGFFLMTRNGGIHPQSAEGLYLKFRRPAPLPLDAVFLCFPGATSPGTQGDQTIYRLASLGEARPFQRLDADQFPIPVQDPRVRCMRMSVCVHDGAALFDLVCIALAEHV